MVELTGAEPMVRAAARGDRRTPAFQPRRRGRPWQLAWFDMTSKRRLV